MGLFLNQGMLQNVQEGNKNVFTIKTEKINRIKSQYGSKFTSASLKLQITDK
jgi:hypothetical protein